MASHKGRKATGYRTKSGAVKVQVLLHPKEFAALERTAAGDPNGMRGPKQPRSVSQVARGIIARHYGYPGGPIKRASKYQPRGFAKC